MSLTHSIHRGARPTRLAAFASAAFLSAAAQAQTDLSWNTTDCGGGAAAGGAITVNGTIGQAEPGPALTGGSYTLTGGFWTVSTVCYANCDNSTIAPVLNVLDFSCFLNKFASGDPYANCDGSTTAPVLNVLDFACFLNKFAAGCP